MTISLQSFRNIVFFTGAGMSAESGVPTYRGQGGIWKEYDHQRYACQRAFDSAPERVWEFHNYRRGLVDACEPNAGHKAIAELEKQRGDVMVITQNIDGLHQQAGTTAIIELHGSLWRVRCDGCGQTKTDRAVPFADQNCACGRFWRPDIVWFGDALRDQDIRDAVTEMKSCDLFVSIGTSAVVYPAAELPLVAREAGATLVEINPEPTGLSHIYDHCLRGKATDMINQMVAA